MVYSKQGITFCTIAALICICMGGAMARENNLMKQVEQTYSTFETMLNEGNQPQELMAFLHDTISDDAAIEVTISNPSAPAGAPDEMTLSKADYINSYVYGPRTVDGYAVQIKTAEIGNDKAQNTVTTRDTLTERGTVKNPMDPQDKGKDFISRTECQSTFAGKDGHAVLQSATCHTSIAFETDV